MTKHSRLAFLFLTLMSVAARADVVDGDWCSEDGRTVFIDGPDIRIPSGAHIIGEYSRHVFRYVGPVGDVESGHDVRMYVEGDDVLRIRRFIDGAEQPEETWHRCKPIA